MIRCSKKAGWWMALLALALSAGAAGAAEIIVAPNGSDDTGDGSAGRPLLTIRKGLSLAQPGDRVLLRGGEYRLAGGEGTVRFPRAGEPEKPIALAAYGNEYAALLGSVRLAAWEPYQGKIWKCAAPANRICGLYEDAERLTHPRETGKRENPPVTSITEPGQWTVADGTVYVWSREGDSPANHRIEASQMVVLNADKEWVRVDGLHIFFGQPIGLDISADHVVAENVEVAHVSNSVDNSYGAYFSGCSNSVLRHSTIHDSYYWGDHSSNSHVVSCIACGDDGPNWVEDCAIFNGGLGVGTKSAARQMFVVRNRIYDVCHGVVMAGERENGPGAGKKDRGHYLVLGNRISDCTDGAYFYSGNNHGNRVFNNLIERCGTAINMRALETAPDSPEIANNLFVANGVAMYLVAGRKGEETLPLFHDAGLRVHHDLYFGNGTDWLNPLDWSHELKMTLAQAQAYRDYGWEAGALSADPLLDAEGRPREGSPALAKGAPLPLPQEAAEAKDWHLGPPALRTDPPRFAPGLALSIDGSPAKVAPGAQVPLHATLKSESEKPIPLSGDAVVTFHFRSANVWYRDRQVLHRARVPLPQRTLAPGETLDLAALAGWENPTNGKAGDPFFLRADSNEWRAGWRLSATLRFIKRDEKTAEALQRLEPLLDSKEVLHVTVE